MVAMMLRSLLLVAIICTIPGIFAQRRHSRDKHPGSREHPYPDDSRDEDDGIHGGDDSSNTGSFTCIKIGDDGETIRLSCTFGCCGSQGDQFCCDDPDKGASHDKPSDHHIKKGVVIALGILAALMTVLGALCCGFGIYKYSNAKQRKTTPTRSTVPIPFYSGRAAMHLEKEKPLPKVQKETPVSDSDDYSLYTVTAPPRYETLPRRNNKLPPLNNPPARPDALVEMENPPPYDLLFARTPSSTAYTTQGTTGSRMHGTPRQFIRDFSSLSQ